MWYSYYSVRNKHALTLFLPWKQVNLSKEEIRKGISKFYGHIPKSMTLWVSQGHFILGLLLILQ